MSTEKSYFAYSIFLTNDRTINTSCHVASGIVYLSTKLQLFSSVISKFLVPCLVSLQDARIGHEHSSQQMEATTVLIAASSVDCLKHIFHKIIYLLYFIIN